ncbi:Ras-related protein Rab-13-like [Oopsacas minuta]|uniref:Ras-related protein Rab-13-like n=1 Tax=Oopsacas minuta TaxID=111878 RepID=A0AAV7J9T4_9METZ|nr:Ras-related protein Rab-13-like [Oopsacas minuta]
MARLIERNYDTLMQVIVIGDAKVGKTAICRQFVSGESPGEDLTATIGVDLNLKIVRARGLRVKLQIWDTAGQERFDKLTTRYYSRAQGVIIVYDITREITFRNVYNWLQQVRTRCKDKVSIFLVGNKTDLEGERRVQKSAGRKVAEAEKINFLETSAVSNENIRNLFLTLSNSVIEKGIPPAVTIATQQEDKEYPILNTL